MDGNGKVETKAFDNYTVKVDVDQGIVDHIFAVFGNIDNYDDILHPGSFKKTIRERKGKIRVVDQHNYGSVLNVIGKPLEIMEIGRDDLPKELLKRFPDATGGVFARTQFLIQTNEGMGAFVRIKEDAVNEWSFGFRALDFDFETLDVESGKEIVVRNVRTLKLYEYGPVMWGANEATMTVGVKHKMPDERDPDEKEVVVLAPSDLFCSQFFDLGETIDAYTILGNPIAEVGRALTGAPVEQHSEEKAAPEIDPRTLERQKMLLAVRNQLAKMN